MHDETGQRLAPELRTHAMEVFEQLNEEHPDTVLFISRPVLRPEVVQASLADVDADGIVVSGQTEHGGTVGGRLAFDERPSTMPAVRAQLLSILERTRTAAGSSVPYTSVELELRKAADQGPWLVQVKRSKKLNPRLLELTFKGAPRVFTPVGLDQSFYVVVPRERGHTQWITPTLREHDLDRMPAEERPYGAYYAVRQYRPDDGEIDLWIILHGNEGTVSNWARTAQPGDRAALFGPRSSFEWPADARRVILLGDETAFAAVAAIAESMPLSVDVEIYVEASAASQIIDFGRSDRVRTHWLFRGEDAPGSGSRLLDALCAQEIDEGTHVFAACEATQARAIRQYLRVNCGLPPARRRVTAYWRWHV
ncbi:MAG: siderophore-interacting protein [Myxococcota bacterium]